MTDYIFSKLLFGAMALTLLIASSLVTTNGFAEETKSQVGGEILKITNKRTGFLIELIGDATIEAGTEVKLVIEGKERTGKVNKVTSNGRTFIRLNKGLPKSVEVGDIIDLDIVGASSEQAEATPSEGRSRLVKGGAAKAYWDEVSFLAAHRKSGTRTDLAISNLSAVGNQKSVGGNTTDDIEYAVTDKHLKVAGDAGWVGRAGFGGGLLMSYDTSERVISADIATASTGTIDSDEMKSTRTVTGFMPYFEYLTRVNTNDLAFGAGIGIPIRNTSVDRKDKNAGILEDVPLSSTAENGVSMEFLCGTGSYAVILALTPTLSGKIKQDGYADVDHSSSEYGIHFETYGLRVKSRAGIVFISSKDSYLSGPSTDTGYRLSGRLDLGFGKFNVIPYLDWQTLARKRDAYSITGALTETDVGSRIALAGIYAPFMSLGFNLKTEKQTQADQRDVKASISGLRIAGGINI